MSYDEVKWRKGWRMSSAPLYIALLILQLSTTSPTSQLILQPLRPFTYVTAHYPTLPLLHLRHSSCSNPYLASPTSQAFHLIHLASRPWLLWYPEISPLWCFQVTINYYISENSQDSFTVFKTSWPGELCSTIEVINEQITFSCQLRSVISCQLRFVIPCLTNGRLDW